MMHDIWLYMVLLYMMHDNWLYMVLLYMMHDYLAIYGVAIYDA